MSMISAQIDELRQMADGQATYRDARAVMLQAADTIWQLRDDLQRADAENAKLRESVKRLMTQRDERLARAETDNAKLRELMADMLRYYAMPNDIDYKREADLLERAHEMGVDV